MLVRMPARGARRRAPVAATRRDIPGPRDRPTDRSASAAAPRRLDRRSPRRRRRSRAPRARGRHGVPGHRLRCPNRLGRRPRRQHLADRLPGDRHRSLVRRPSRRHDLPADRQLRPAARRRPVGTARGSGGSSSPTRRPLSSTMRGSSRRCCASVGCAAFAHVRGARRASWRRGSRALHCLRQGAGKELECVLARMRSDHQLVRSGPFAVVRHPIYLALFFYMLSFAIAFGHWAQLAIGIPLYWAGALIRIREEDKLLAAQFGDDHARYVREVPAVIPFLR